MAGSVYDLAVNVSTDIASLYTGLNAAADRVDQFATSVNRRLDSITSSFKALAEISIAGFGAHAFADMIEGAIEAQSKLVDLATTSGTTASQLSALLPAAKLSGTGIDTVTGASAKFSKSLIDVQTGTGKAAEAFKALGFNAQDAARFLANPSQGLLELAQHLNTFSDDGTKTAAVMALLGKSGQELLPFLKQLGDQSALTATLTDQQAEAAHRLEDQWRTLQLAGDDLKNTVASAIVPALSDVLKAFTDASGGPDSLGAKIKTLASDGTLTEWALQGAQGVAVLAESIVGLIRTIAALHSDVDLIVSDIQLIIAATNAPKLKLTGSFGFTPEEAKAANDALDAALKARNDALARNDEAWQDLWNKDGAVLSTAIGKQLDALHAAAPQFQAALTNLVPSGSSFANSLLGGTGNPLNASLTNQFGLAGGVPAAKPSTGFSGGGALAGISQYQQALQSLQKQAAEASAELDALFSGEKVTQAEKYLAALKSNAAVWDTFNAKQKEAIELAATIAKGREQDVQKIKDQQAAAAAAAQTLAKLAAAQAAAVKTISDAATGSQLQAITTAQEAVKRQYDRGLLDFKNYYAQEAGLQHQALDAQVANQQLAVTQQEQLVEGLQQQINALDPSKFASHEEYLKTVNDLYLKLVPANASLTALQGKLNNTVAKGTEIDKDYVEQLIAANSAILTSNKSLQNQISQQQLANDTIGLTASQIQLVIAARDQDILSQARANGASEETIAALQKQIELRQQLGAVLAKGEGLQQSLDLIKSLDQEAQSVFENIFNNGHDAFQKLGDDIKKYLIDLLYQLTIRPILINIASQATGINPTNVAGALGQGSNPLLNLLGGNNGSSLVSSGASSLAGSFATSAIGQSIGLSSAVGGSAGIAADAVGGIAGGTAADIGLTGAGVALTTAASFIPVVGLVIAALFASGVFDSKPSETKGQFQISPGTTGFEDNAYTPSAYGNLGFNDANTQQFSGQAAQVFNQMVGGALDAFHSRFSAEQSDKFATILKTMTFDAFEGTYTTEDFIKKYGGQVLQQVVVAAFQELDPALADVAKNFTGTADEVAKFANSLLGIYDATKAIGNDDFTKTIDTALAGADQATADKVLAFVTIVQGLSPALDGLSESMQKIDPANVTKFIDALGGAQQALQGMAFINANFTTSAQQAQQAQTNLSNAWQAAGVTADDLAHAGLSHIPQTHAEMLQLLNSLDLNTQHGRDLAAALINNVAPAFVTVEGTANAAAQAMIAAAQKGEDLYNQHFLTPQEQTANRISVDETALYNATKQGTLLNKVLGDMGLSVIPTTVEGVRQWHDAVIAKYGADSDEAHAMEAAIPDIYDLIDATGGFGAAAQQAANQVNDAINSISHPVDVNQYLQGVATNIANIQALANEGTGTFGDKLATQITLLGSAMAKTQDQINAAMAKNDFSSIDYLLQPQLAAYKKASAAAADELARYTVLAAQYDSARAEQLVGLQDWYAAQQKLFGGQSDVLAALNVIYKQKWDAIVNGVQSGVDGTLDQLAKLKQGIADYLKGLQVGNLSPLSPHEQLDQAQQAYVEELLKAQQGDQTALGDVTKFFDAYLKQAQSFFGSASSQYRDIFTAGTTQLGDLAGSLPNGMPTSTTSTGVAGDAIAAVVPTNGRMVSNTDIQDLAKQLVQAIADSAQANSDDIAVQTTSLAPKPRTAITLK